MTKEIDSILLYQNDITYLSSADIFLITSYIVSEQCIKLANNINDGSLLLSTI